jgi:hypothetical protein
MKRLALILVALAACTPQMQDELTRDAARTAIRPVLEQRFPGVPLEPVTDCVIDNASSSELLSLASDAVTGATANTGEIVTNILSRPETLNCVATEGLPVLLNRL